MTLTPRVFLLGMLLLTAGASIAIGWPAVVLCALVTLLLALDAHHEFQSLNHLSKTAAEEVLSKVQGQLTQLDVEGLKKTLTDHENRLIHLSNRVGTR